MTYTTQNGIFKTHFGIYKAKMLSGSWVLNLLIASTKFVLTTSLTALVTRVQAKGWPHFHQCNILFGVLRWKAGQSYTVIP